MESRVKRTVTLELQRAFPNLDVGNMLDVYESFATLETPVERGVRSDWMDNVVSFYQISESMRASHNNLLNSETFFKKVLYILDEDAYQSVLQDRTQGLWRTLEQIGLLRWIPERVNISSYDWKNLSNPLQQAIVRTYQLRNNASHSSDEWSITEMLGNVNAIMISTMRAVWDNRERIQSISRRQRTEDDYKVDAYLKNIVREYDKKVQTGFRYVPLLWEPESRSGAKPRPMDIRGLADEKQVMLIGEAGCGKTTALEYLEYQDAKAYRSGESQFIPVRLALIHEDAHLSLQDMICKKLNIPATYCETLLQGGLLHLFIDGLNELSTEIAVKKDFVTTLETFLSRYPDIFAAISDRRYSPVQLKLNRKYILKKMQKEDILHYAESKSEYNSNVATRLSAILDEPGFRDLEYTPLLVNQLITVFSSGAAIPEDPADLVGIYLDALIRREYEEKRDMNAAPGKLDVILMQLALEDIPEEGISLIQAQKACATVMRTLGIQVESDACINLAVQLGILTQKGRYIDFVLESYKMYYLMRAMEENLDKD